jgi:6-phosphofructokinase 1
MNAAIRAVVRMGIYRGWEPVGINRGFAGLIEGDFRPLSLSSVGDIIHRGGTILRTARSEEFKSLEGRLAALNKLQNANLEGLIVIGGDGSFRGALELYRSGFIVAGVPGTIDNDVPGTDYSIGFDTAVNTVLDAINKIRDTATSHERIFIIEVMGRRAGNIALMAGIAGGAESILLPEVPPDLEDVIAKIERGRARGKLHSIILVAEGAGSAIEVSKYIETKMKLETRISILGHIQRGGNPSAFDRMLASRMGAKAVELLLDGIGGKMVGISGQNIITLDMEEALNQEKKIDMSVYHLASILAI